MSSKCMHNSPKFSYREKRKNRISTIMRSATPRCQAHKVLIDKRKYQFSWTIVFWQVTRNSQFFMAVGNYLVTKSRFQDRSNNFFLEVSKCRIIWLTSQIVQITHSSENILMTSSLITARFLKMPKTRKRSRGAANSPVPVDIGDDANGRFLNSQMLFYGLIRNNCRLHNNL